MRLARGAAALPSLFMVMDRDTILTHSAGDCMDCFGQFPSLWGFYSLRCAVLDVLILRFSAAWRRGENQTRDARQARDTGRVARRDGPTTQGTLCASDRG